MAYIAFIAVLFGAAGIAGGIEAENIAGTIAASMVHAGGILAMAIAGRKERDLADGDDPRGSSPVDKPAGISDAERARARTEGGIDHADERGKGAGN